MDNKILELKFNPIKFSSMGFNGSVGREGGTSHFFKSTLAQNIIYAIYHKERTINEIADLLGVSPVYIESEVDYLEEYSFLIKLPGNRYMSNMIIDQVTDDYLDLVDKMYRRASEIIANELFDEIINSELLSSEGIYYPEQDKNFLMWTLIPFILASSESGEDPVIKFEDVATVRKDGGYYIANASIDNPSLKNKQLLEDREKWYGPLWNQYDNTILWQINSKWCNREMNIETYSDTSQYEIRLLNRYVRQHDLSSEEFSYLAEKGYIKGSIGQDQFNIVWLKDKSIKAKCLEIGAHIKLKYKDELTTIQSEYIKTVLAHTPKHLQKVRMFEFQDILGCNGVFILYSLRALLTSGRLKEVEDDYQKKALKTLLITEV